MRLRDQRDVQHRVALSHTMKTNLRRQDRLARPCHAFDQIQAALDQPAA